MVCHDDEIWKMRSAQEFLKTNPVAYSFSVKTGNSNHWQGFYKSEEECEEAQYQYYKSAGYKPLRFWQFWRFSDTHPSKEIIDRLKGD